MPLPPKRAQSIPVWLFKNKQNNTLDTKPQLISWPFLTWNFICVYYSQGRKFFSLFTCDSEATQGPSHSQCDKLSICEMKKLAPVLMSVRNSECPVSFSKDHLLHPRDIKDTCFPSPNVKTHKKPLDLTLSPGRKKKMCPQHPFLRSLCSRNM